MYSFFFQWLLSGPKAAKAAQQASLWDRRNIQGLPSGFDQMYLALADRNMQVRFGLKVVGES